MTFIIIDDNKVYSDRMVVKGSLSEAVSFTTKTVVSEAGDAVFIPCGFLPDTEAARYLLDNWKVRVSKWLQGTGQAFFDVDDSVMSKLLVDLKRQRMLAWIIATNKGCVKLWFHSNGPKFKCVGFDPINVTEPFVFGTDFGIITREYNLTKDIHRAFALGAKACTHIGREVDTFDLSQLKDIPEIKVC